MCPSGVFIHITDRRSSTLPLTLITHTSLTHISHTHAFTTQSFSLRSDQLPSPLTPVEEGKRQILALTHTCTLCVSLISHIHRKACVSEGTDNRRMHHEGELTIHLFSFLCVCECVCGTTGLSAKKLFH